jgi:subtilisin family serine protease
VLDASVRAATERGALVLAASGNGSSRTAYEGILMPANAPAAWAVGSVNSNFERSSFSRFDALDGPTVDLMAPGGFRVQTGGTIYSTGLRGDYAYLAGTSMATPYVAGVAALIWSREPTLEASEVAVRLRETAYKNPTWNANEYGAGVVCADRALGLASQCGLD